MIRSKNRSTPKSKKCARCQKTKRLEQFGINERMKLGRKSYCRVCSKELQSARYAAQKAEGLAKQVENPAKVKRYGRRRTSLI